MSALFCCTLQRRLQAVRKHNAAAANPAGSLNAVDYLEIYTDDQKTLRVVFLLSPTTLTVANCRIEGGVRITGISVSSIDPIDVTKPTELLLHVDAAGDFSEYTLSFVDAADPTQPAPGFDPRLAAIDFSFKARCPSDFDCAPVEDCPAPRAAEPAISYLAKDYETFRALMLDRIGVLQPGSVDRRPADGEVALVELLAYAADHLSYYQDAVATEAYLGTARGRVSLRRHARLLDYPIHDGCNARGWIAFDYDPGNPATTLPIARRTVLLTRGESATSIVLASDLNRMLVPDTEVFETCDDLTLVPGRTRISFYTWSDADCWLPRGATRATLKAAATLGLAAGDVLIFEELLSPVTGLAADADRSHRHAVRLLTATAGVDPVTASAIVEITWGVKDALPFALCLSAQIQGALAVTEDVSVVRANVVLADHGLTRTGASLVPPRVDGDSYRPALPDIGIAHAEPYPPTAPAGAIVSASELLTQDPRQALPSNMTLADPFVWQPRRDLLKSDRFARDFVVETENDGSARLRFGNDINGLRPTLDATLTATYRLGGGSRGNVGAESITRIVSNSLASLPGLQRIRNPLPAVGGLDPESAEQIRQYAPEAFRVQQRAVTETDYATVAAQYPGVQRAVARFRWTGSWYTVFIAVDRVGGGSTVDDPAFREGLETYIGQFRLAGYDIELRDPLYAPLDIALQVCVAPDRLAADVELALIRRLGTGLYDGVPACFNPDRFSFGDPLYLSRLVEAALEVPGVASIKVQVFQRWGKTPNGELQAELIQPQPLEVLRLDNDPSFPENGRLTLDMRGGQ